MLPKCLKMLHYCHMLQQCTVEGYQSALKCYKSALTSSSLPPSLCPFLYLIPVLLHSFFSQLLLV